MPEVSCNEKSWRIFFQIVTRSLALLTRFSPPLLFFSINVLLQKINGESQRVFILDFGCHNDQGST